MRPFENKTKVDPGRFRATVSFYKQVSEKLPSGGTEMSLTLVETKRACEVPLNSSGQVEIMAGASILNGDKNYIIRASKDFVPEKDMNVKVGDKSYTIAAIAPLDQPVNYYKILCLHKDDFNG